MLILKNLRVRGFRAYVGEKTFEFDRPVIFLFGGNHQGKSSTLNAIEWCLFGNECVGSETGIRERIDWEIPNRNMYPLDAIVQVELENIENRERFTICRKWIRPRKDDLNVILLDGQSLRGQKADEKLAELLYKLSFRDFLTIVYQHQEAIRAILTQEPKDRNDAIDRLLGLSDYRNTLAGIEAAKLSGVLKGISDKFDGFSREIEVALRTRESDLAEKKDKAMKEGVKKEDISEKGVLEIAEIAKKQLHQFASEIGLSLIKLETPKYLAELQPFVQIVANGIRRFRSEMPDVEKQQELYNHQSKIIALESRYGQTKKTAVNTHGRLVQFVRENGDIEFINSRKMNIQEELRRKRDELRSVNARAATIDAAINCIKLQPTYKDACPVCGKETPDLLGYLEREWKEKFEQQAGSLQNEIVRLETSLNRLHEMSVEYGRLKGDLETTDVERVKITKDVGVFLGREITDKDDCEAIFRTELDRVLRELKKLEEAVRSKQERLDEVSSLMEQIHVIAEIIRLEEKKRVVEEIQKSSEYRQMEELQDKMAVLVDDVEKIKQAITESSHEAARQKVNAAGNIIDSYFRRITNNPSVIRLEFALTVDSRTGLNSYFFKDQNGKDLIPVLSQGDLNAMALSIFLGLASSKETSQPLGFIMLDDPSQSLSSTQKEKLVNMLDEIAQDRMVILSSMDSELQNLAASRITKTKAKYVFSEWSPEEGPQVKRE